MEQKDVLTQALERLAAGNEDECRSLVAAELGLSPEHADVSYAVGMLAVGLGDYAQAESLLKLAVIETAPANYFNDLGVVLFQREAIMPAADAFLQALQRDPGFESAQANYQSVLATLPTIQRKVVGFECEGVFCSLTAEPPATWHTLLPASAFDLMAAIRAGACENYPTALTYFDAWLSSAHLAEACIEFVDLGDGRIRLKFSPMSPSGASSSNQNIALLFDLLGCRSQFSLVLTVAATLIRYWRRGGEKARARRVERFCLDCFPGTEELLAQLCRCMLPQKADCGNGGRQQLLLIGTCIAEGIRFFLNSSPAFRSRYQLKHFITNRAARSMSEFLIDDAMLHVSGVVVHVHPAWADWGNEQAYIDLLARIPPHIQKISIPYPVFQPLWPFYCKDPRHGESFPESLWGPFEERPYYPYGDSMALGLMQKLGNAEEALRQYFQVDMEKEIDLDRLLAKTLEIMREKEEQTDVKIVDYIADNFRERCMFDTVNHISNAGMLRIANQVLQRLSLPPLPETMLERVRDILSPQVPIHPAVVRHFNLSYVNSDSRYAIDHHRFQTCTEYLADYMSFV